MKYLALQQLKRDLGVKSKGHKFILTVQQKYLVVVTKQKGTPDVIAFRSRPNGGFDVVVREVKGPGDAIRKEQYELVERMSEVGIDADYQWY